MSTDRKQLNHVKYLWQDEVANKLSGLDRLVYRSNKLGEDLTLTNTGGGNTSSKLTRDDPLTGEGVEVLWVKGSGGDLRTAKRDGFASLYLDKVRAMKSLYVDHPERGPKTKSKMTCIRCTATASLASIHAPVRSIHLCIRWSHSDTWIISIRTQ